MWIFLHSIFLFWAVVFPFNYRQLRISRRIRYAHIISVVLAVVVPLPAALVHLKDGHIAYYTPTILCQGRNRDYAYYTFVLPVSIIMCITSCLLVVIIWTIFKVIYQSVSCACIHCSCTCTIFIYVYICTGVYLEKIVSSKEGG